MANKNIKRGEIYWADFSGAKSYKEKGQRPVIVLQNNIGNQKLSTTIVAPATTTKRSNPVIVQIPKNVCGMKEDSFFLLSNILTIEQNILGDKIGDVTLGLMEEMETAIELSLGLENISEHPFYKYR